MHLSTESVLCKLTAIQWHNRGLVRFGNTCHNGFGFMADTRTPESERALVQDDDDDERGNYD